MADAVLPLAHARPRLRRGRLRRRGPAVRGPRGVRPAARRRPCAGAARHRRRRPEPHLERARVVPGGAGRPGVAGAGPLPVPRRRRGRPAERLEQRLRRSGLDARVADRPVVPAPVRQQPARPRLDEPGGAPGAAAGAALLAGPGRRRLPDRRRARPLQEPDAGRPPGGQAEQRRRRARVGPRRGARGVRGVAAAARLLRRRPDDGRRGLPVRRAADRPLRRRLPAAPGLQLHRDGHAVGCGSAAADARDGAGALLTRHVGAVEPRPHAARHALRRRLARSAPWAGRHRAAARPARLAVPLPGGGARPGRGGRAARAPAGPDLPAHRGRAARPGRLPHADAVGGGRGRLRLHDRRAVAAVRRGQRGPRGRRAARGPRLGAGGLPAAARREKGCAAGGPG